MKKKHFYAGICSDIHGYLWSIVKYEENGRWIYYCFCFSY